MALGKLCKGNQIGIEHYFLPNPNASPTQKWAENLGYCAACFSRIGQARYYGIKSRDGESRNRHANKQQCGTDTL